MDERYEDGRDDDDDHSKSEIVVEVKEWIESRLACDANIKKSESRERKMTFLT